MSAARTRLTLTRDDARRLGRKPRKSLVAPLVRPPPFLASQQRLRRMTRGGFIMGAREGKAGKYLYRSIVTVPPGMAQNGSDSGLC